MPRQIQETFFSDIWIDPEVLAAYMKVISDADFLAMEFKEW